MLMFTGGGREDFFAESVYSPASLARPRVQACLQWPDVCAGLRCATQGQPPPPPPQRPRGRCAGSLPGAAAPDLPHPQGPRQLPAGEMAGLGWQTLRCSWHMASLAPTSASEHAVHAHAVDKACRDCDSELVCSCLQEVTTPAGQWLYADADLLKQHGLTGAHASPPALLPLSAAASLGSAAVRACASCLHQGVAVLDAGASRRHAPCSAEEDRAPAALLAAPPTKLLISLEQMQQAFWEQTAYGRGMLHQLEHTPVEPTPESRRAVQTAPYGNRWGAREGLRRAAPCRGKDRLACAAFFAQKGLPFWTLLPAEDGPGCVCDPLQCVGAGPRGGEATGTAQPAHEAFLHW